MKFVKCILNSLSILFLLFTVGCPTVPQQTSGPATRDIGGGTIEHSSSGMRFPPAVHGFKLAGVRQYDAAGVNVSAGYNSVSLSLPIAATVYVYPSPPVSSFGSPESVVADARRTLARGEFQRAKDEIQQARPTAKLLDEQPVPSPRSTAGQTGFFARFAYSESFAGNFQPLESLLYVYCHVGSLWTVKYRITYPAASLEARSVVNRFLQDLEWTLGKPNKAPEPTPGSVTPRAPERVIEMKQKSADLDVARGAPAPVVAHL